MDEQVIPRADRQSLADSAAHTLRQALRDGRWAVGERIPVESKLALALGVSKGTLREAVRGLVAQGLLEVRQGSGTYVRAPLNPEDSLKEVREAGWRDQFEVRRALEVEATRLAASRRTVEDIRHLHALLDERGESDKPLADFVARDLRFHTAVVAVARNKALSETYRLLSAYVEETIAGPRAHGVPDPDMAAHRRIVDAIAAGDPEAAGASARALIDTALERLNEWKLQ